MDFLSKTLILTILLYSSSYCFSQTVLATETFGVGSVAGTSANGFAGDMGVWTVATTGAEGGSANNWYVSGEECGTIVGSCGFACPGGNNTLHVSAIGGLCGTPDCGAAYDETSGANQTNKRAISPTIDCTNHFFIELNFEYIAAQGDDVFWVEYSLDNGATWNTFTGGNVAESGCCCFLAGFCVNPLDPQPCIDALALQGYWSSINLSFPVGADNNNQVKFAFHWSNDGNGVGTDPSVAIDDITVTHATSLPIELTDFKAYSTAQGNRLTWNAASKSGLSHFEIQHSPDGEFFRKIGSLEDNASNHFEFLHQNQNNDNYYRLKMVDENGAYEYSDRVYLKTALGQIYLDKNYFTYTIQGLNDLQGDVLIIDMSGKEVLPRKSFDLSTSEVEINLLELNAGIYVIKVISNQGEKHFKILR